MTMTSTKRRSPIEDTGYPVTVDHSQSLRQMIAAGKYDELPSPRAKSREYPITGSGVSHVDIVFLRFKPYVTSDQVKRRMRRRGYRPANVPELLALGVAYPHLQLEGGDIVELGTVDTTNADDPGVLLLGKTADGGRELKHDCYEQEWDDGVRFAAVAL